VRGCLWTLLSAAVVLGIVAWIGLPLLAAAAIRAALAAEGLSAARLEVTVAASPPFRLFLLRADAVTVEATDLRGPGLTAATVHLRLAEVDLGVRTARQVEGVAVDVRLLGLGPGGGDLALAELDLAGSGGGPEAVLWETSDELAALIGQVGLGGAAVRVVAIQPPATVVLVLDGATVDARLSVKDGRLLLTVPGLPVVTLAAPDPATVALDSVAVVGGRLRLGARITPRLLGLEPPEGAGMNRWYPDRDG
jgi:hypothetical protein